jgi:hypothetical protein
MAAARKVAAHVFIPDVLAAMGLQNRSTLNRRIASGLFPPAMYEHQRRRAFWFTTELKAWQRVFQRWGLDTVRLRLLTGRLIVERQGRKQPYAAVTTRNYDEAVARIIAKRETQGKNGGGT